MASGVKVADAVKDLYNSMKVVKNDDCPEQRIRVAIFAIINDFIEVENSYTEKDLSGKDVFAFFRNQLKKEQCRYILYDCHYETRELSKKQELVFALWCPDEGPIKEKMAYASSKDAIKKILVGIKHDFQMNDPADCGDRHGFAEKLGKNILTLEGKPLCE